MRERSARVFVFDARPLSRTLSTLPSLASWIPARFAAILVAGVIGCGPMGLISSVFLDLDLRTIPRTTASDRPQWSRGFFSTDKTWCINIVIKISQKLVHRRTNQ